MKPLKWNGFHPTISGAFSLEFWFRNIIPLNLIPLFQLHFHLFQLFTAIGYLHLIKKINLGMEDKDAPVIYLWDEEMTEDESTANNGE